MTTRTVDAVVGSEIVISSRDVTHAEAGALEIALRYRNPKHAASLRRGGRARFVPEWLTALRRTEGKIHVPRGAHAVVTKVLGDRARWRDERCAGEPHAFALKRPMREHQYALAEALATHGQGIAHGATGSGKTGGGACGIALCGTRTLWIAPTIDLVRQAAQELHRFLGVEPAIAIGGHFVTAPIVVSTWATVSKHPDKLKGGFGLLVVDEAHGALASTRLEVVRSCDARFRLALTATLKTEDTRAPLLAWHFGKTLTSYGVDAGVRAGILAAPVWRELRTEFRFDYSGPHDWGPLLDALFSDTGRACLIADDVARDAKGRLALVLSTRKAALEILRAMLLERAVRAEVLTGDLPRRERESVLERARRGEVEALLATQLADEGLDIVRADRVFLCAPSKSPTRLLQRIGRVVRIADGKRQPEVVDVVDGNVPLLARQARARRRVFASTWGSSLRGAA